MRMLMLALLGTILAACGGGATTTVIVQAPPPTSTTATVQAPPSTPTSAAPQLLRDIDPAVHTRFGMDLAAGYIGCMNGTPHGDPSYVDRSARDAIRIARNYPTAMYGDGNGLRSVGDALIDIAVALEPCYPPLAAELQSAGNRLKGN